MRKDQALDILASVGSVQVLTKTIAADVDEAFEGTRADSDLEETMSLVKGIVTALGDVLAIARRQAEEEYDKAEVVPS